MPIGGGSSLKEKMNDFIEYTKEISTQTKYNKLLEALIIITETPGEQGKRLPRLSEKTKNLLQDRAKLLCELI